jgi:hypothetical protein
MAASPARVAPTPNHEVRCFKFAAHRSVTARDRTSTQHAEWQGPPSSNPTPHCDPHARSALTHPHSLRGAIEGLIILIFCGILHTVLTAVRYTTASVANSVTAWSSKPGSRVHSNWLARSAVNREVASSSLAGSGCTFFFASLWPLYLELTRVRLVRFAFFVTFLPCSPFDLTSWFFFNRSQSKI